MSKSIGSKDLSETFQDFLTGAAKLLAGLGGLATLISVGLLVFTCFRVAGEPSLSAEALKNIPLFRQVLTVGSLGLAIGAGYLFWGSEFLGAGLLALGALLYFAPALLPMALSSTTGPAIGESLATLQVGGTIIGLVAVIILVVDVVGRVRNRVKEGVKADHLKFGKGVKEEQDKQNVFLGKCFQLPYCRKFVRERCPIYHAKRACWREKVGCMCEEQVIRSAMENKPIPKDAVLAANFIPRNHRLTEAQKIQRCKTCVIYNEHQKHKYRAALPVLLLVFALVYGLGHTALHDATERLVQGMDTVIKTVTFHGQKFVPPGAFVEGLLFLIMLVLLTYSLKILEFLVFKLKI